MTIKNAFLWLFLFGFCSASLAQSGIYITGESGWANQNGMPEVAYNQIQTAIQRAKKNRLPVFRFAMGYLHDFNDRIGLGFEAGKGWYRGTNYTSGDDNNQIKTSSTTTEFLASLVLHLSPIDFFVKYGGIRHTLSGYTIQADTDTSNTKIQPEATVGINCHLGGHFALVAEYLHTFGDKFDGLSGRVRRCPSLNVFLLGARIAFW